MIEFYEPDGPFGYLANFAQTPFFLDGQQWESVEHYYQAQKFVARPRVMQMIAGAPSASCAKQLARQHRDVRDPSWREFRDQVMYRSIAAKFNQNRDLARRLLSTGDEELVESAPDDRYWGRNTSGVGLNRMGILLMYLRQELRKFRADI